MAVTLKDVAIKANVSISTVSRVINNDMSKPASKETQEKVWKIVKELGYIPNQNARNLIKNVDSTEQTKTLTKAIGCIFTSTKDTFHDPFYSQIARCIQEEASRRGYVLGYSFSSCDMSFSSLYNNLMTHPVDGAIILGRFDRETLTFFKNNINNLVYAGVNVVNGGFDEVICDGYKGAVSALKYLIHLGHNKIGFIGEVTDKAKVKVVNEHRYQAYQDTMKLHNLDGKEENIINVELNSDSGYNGMKEFLEQNTELPTAFFCANDLVAIGAMKAIYESGLRVPDDISIIGLDNIEMSRYVTPSLTTVDIPKEELGRYAVKLLIEQIEGSSTIPIRIDIPFTMIERESCKPLKQ